MTETAEPDHRASSSAGTVVFLIDESTSMDEGVAGGTKSKAQSIGTALNSLFNQLTDGPVLELAVLGYRKSPNGESDIASRWQGPLAGRDFVSTAELANAPLAVEDRVRRLPAADGFGPVMQETVKFSVWYRPVLGSPVTSKSALVCCAELLDQRGSQRPAPNKPPLIVQLVADPHTGDAEGDSFSLPPMDVPGEPPLMVIAHLASSDRIPPVLYPSTDVYLQIGQIRTLYQACSELPLELAKSLRASQVTVNVGGKGLIYNARMVDLIRFFSLVKAYAGYQPPTPAMKEPLGLSALTTTASGNSDENTVANAASEAQGLVKSDEHVVLVMLVLDRSIRDPSQACSESVFLRLRDQTNELLGKISKHGEGHIHVGLVSYGADSVGQVALQTGFAGPQAGRATVRDTELAEQAIRIDQVTEKVPNGIGGIVEVTREKPVFVDTGPTSAAASVPAFAAVAEAIAEWSKTYPPQTAAPIVVHLTRGCVDPGEYNQALAQLRRPEMPEALVYHVVGTESAHASVFYPEDPAKLAAPSLVVLWERTSPLLGRTELATRKPSVGPDSRGIVINGRFDLLLDAIATVFSQ